VTVLLVMVGGAAGAIGRYVADRIAVGRGYPSRWGTFTVNMAGTLLLGILAGSGAAANGLAGALLATGCCGALTTYSTFAFETTQLVGAPDGGLRPALRYAGTTLTVGLAAMAVGFLIAARFAV